MEALIIIDMQDGYIENKRNSNEFNNVVDYINYTSSMFRKEHRPVIFIRDISEGEGTEFRIVDEIARAESDHEIVKTYNNSFWETNLDNLLRNLKVDMVVLAGNAVEYCVTATYFGALERGYNPVILQNGVLSETQEGYLALVKTKPLVSVAALNHMLAKANIKR